MSTEQMLDKIDQQHRQKDPKEEERAFKKSEGLVPTLSVLYGLDVRFRFAEKERQEEVTSIHNNLVDFVLGRKQFVNIKQKKNSDSERSFSLNRHSNQQSYFENNNQSTQIGSLSSNRVIRNQSQLSEYNSPYKLKNIQPNLSISGEYNAYSSRQTGNQQQNQKPYGNMLPLQNQQRSLSTQRQTALENSPAKVEVARRHNQSLIQDISQSSIMIQSQIDMDHNQSCFVDHELKELTFKPKINNDQGKRIVGIFNMNEQKLRQVIKKMSSEDQYENQFQADEINLKRAEFFAKTILNAKKVAEYNFDEDLQKYKINKDKTSQLFKMMQLRGKKQNIEDSRREQLLQMNQIPKGKILEKNEQLVRVLQDTSQSFSRLINESITEETNKMAEYLHEAEDDLNIENLGIGNGSQAPHTTSQQRLKSDIELFTNAFREVKNPRQLPKINFKTASRGTNRNNKSFVGEAPNLQNLILDEVSKAKLAVLVKQESERLKLETEMKFSGFENIPIGIHNEAEKQMRNESMKRFQYLRELEQQRINPQPVDKRKELINSINDICTKAGQKKFGMLNYTLLKQDVENGDVGFDVSHVINHVQQSTRKSKRRINQIEEDMLSLLGQDNFKKKLQ
ncbi:UNKNOWN [Stylonychia lemnae]|uniref:Uncharacterized protein n=1 Tax=Stylonychia lemnae TaxID=5949 RepID=A0A078AL86_STYLE|nr:UNKNOWN [Stylonychia lemnae]|eukprot:CDW83125.1 UNKNOWN [Stylonychia lemnae]